MCERSFVLVTKGGIGWIVHKYTKSDTDAQYMHNNIFLGGTF
jgi:hypothetical protein